jgi:CMP-N-acetylneuraminic acid synthetase
MKAIIAARGGSKRIPRKNVLPICGHPLVAWTITQARCSHHVDDVFVTTDDDEIAEIAQAYGAEVIRRPYWPDADQAAAIRPFCHAMQSLVLEREASRNEVVLTALPTSPLRFPHDFDRLIEYQQSVGAENVHTMAKMRECFVYEITGKHEVKLYLGAKHYEYASLSFSGNVHSIGWYLDRELPHGADHDSVLDKGLIHPVDPPPMPCIWAEPWQGLEVDVLEEFMFTELVFDQFILQGRGMEIYHEYAEGI